MFKAYLGIIEKASIILQENEWVSDRLGRSATWNKKGFKFQAKNSELYPR